MTPDDLTRALARLSNAAHVVVTDQNWTPVGFDLSVELAALIEDATIGLMVDDRERCYLCDQELPHHFSNCSLTALVRAINGEGK